MVTGTSLVITTWNNTVRENNFFKDQLFWFLEHIQDFEVAVSGATRVKELKPSLPSHFETSKYERLNVF